MSYEAIASVVALVVGWILSEASHFLRRRGNHREAVHLALSELLLLRHSLIVHEFIFTRFVGQRKLPLEILAQLHSFIPTPLQEDPSISARFNQALVELAKHDPFSASRLRGKNIVEGIERFLRPVAQRGNAIPSTNGLNLLLYEETIPILERLIINSARKAGLATWLKAIYEIQIKRRVSKEVVGLADRHVPVIRGDLDAWLQENSASR